MFKIFDRKNTISELYMILARNNSQLCKKRDYECPHEKKPTRTELDQQKKQKVHPFLEKKDCKNRAYFWRNIFFFLCVPAMFASSVYTFFYSKRPKRPPYIEYEHLRKRQKPFPWGDGNKTLFHNPYTNALPGGYETEEEDDDDD